MGMGRSWEMNVNELLWKFPACMWMYLSLDWRCVDSKAFQVSDFDFLHSILLFMPIWVERYLISSYLWSLQRSVCIYVLWSLVRTGQVKLEDEWVGSCCAEHGPGEKEISPSLPILSLAHLLLALYKLMVGACNICEVVSFIFTSRENQSIMHSVNCQNVRHLNFHAVHWIILNRVAISRHVLMVVYTARLLWSNFLVLKLNLVMLVVYGFVAYINYSLYDMLQIFSSYFNGIVGGAAFMFAITIVMMVVKAVQKRG